MSVLECDRNNCDKVMCDYYSDEFGYLCYECMEELINYCKYHNRADHHIIGEFMNSRKHNKYSIDVEDIVYSYFKRR